MGAAFLSKGILMAEKEQGWTHSQISFPPALHFYSSHLTTWSLNDYPIGLKKVGNQQNAIYRSHRIINLYVNDLRSMTQPVAGLKFGSNSVTLLQSVTKSR